MSARSPRGRPGRYLVVRTTEDKVVFHLVVYSDPSRKERDANRLFRKSPTDVLDITPWSKATAEQKRQAIKDMDGYPINQD